MARVTINVVLGISILSVAVLVAGCSTGFAPQDEEDVSETISLTPSASGPINGLVQSNAGGGVTIDVEWLGEQDGFLKFDVAMNTHSVDLDGYDLGKLSVLRDVAGAEHHPLSWDSGPGGHHRNGTLIFPLPDLQGNEGSGELQLIIRGVAGVEERVLTWNLG